MCGTTTGHVRCQLNGTELDGSSLQVEAASSKKATQEVWRSQASDMGVELGDLFDSFDVNASGTLDHVELLGVIKIFKPAATMQVGATVCSTCVVGISVCPAVLVVCYRQDSLKTHSQMDANKDAQVDKAEFVKHMESQLNSMPPQKQVCACALRCCVCHCVRTVQFVCVCACVRSTRIDPTHAL